MTDAPTLDGWKKRRRIIHATLVFCAVHVSWLTFGAADTVLHQQLAYALVGLAVTTIGFYVGGAVWDDHNARKFGNTP